MIEIHRTMGMGRRHEDQLLDHHLRIHLSYAQSGHFFGCLQLAHVTFFQITICHRNQYILFTVLKNRLKIVSFVNSKAHLCRHTGAKRHFLFRNYQEFNVWKMWIFWKRGSKNVNFVKYEALKLWILWKMRFWNCEFCEKWDFEIVNFMKNEALKMWILSKRLPLISG